ncbi:MAG: diacylglycerol O-acyltransferase [Arcticibacterium sp.]|jgi:diacylglycerol O-acyltransferase
MLDKITKMLTLENLEPISGMDATFLYTDTPTSPMNIGSVLVIEGSLDFETFKATLHSRIHQFTKFRQKLMYAPLKIDYPCWVDDPNFDVNLHITRTALPKPGGWRELREMASHFFSQALDHNRPLWEIKFVEGLEELPQVPKGSVAIITKMHHVAIDGVGGAGLMSLFLDFTPEKKDIPEPKPWKPKPIPNEFSLAINSALSFAKNPLKLPKLASEALKATVKAGFLTRIQKSDLPTAPFTAPNTPLNGTISARKKWNTAILSLERVLNLKKIMGATVNDVLLAICSGALRRYLDEKGKLPSKPLVAMVPISTRAKDNKSPGVDNQISAILVQIATNIADPLERLETIQENTSRGKTYQGAMGAKSLAKMAEAIPFGIANNAAKLYSRFNVSELLNPVFNVAITNVPGPPMPLYVNGHKLLTVMGSAPVIDGMGLIITILSYDNHITISPFSDTNSMPDLDMFTKYIWESANELEAAVLAKEKTKTAKKTRKPRKLASNKLFLELGKFLKNLPDNGKEKSGVFQFVVKGDIVANWTVDISKYPGEVREERTEGVDATFTISDEHLMKISNGDLDVQTAFIQGRLKIDGELDQAMRLAKLISKMLDVRK